MTSYIGALDQGTTSTRFLLFTRGGDIHSMSQLEHTQHYPAPGWVEHDAEELWRNTLTVMADALAQSSLLAKDVAAIGITNQRETTVLWDRLTGRPVHRALVWQDTRVEALVDRYKHDGLADHVRALTGLPLATYFSALKLQWLLDHVPGARRSAEQGRLLFGTIDSWIVWNMTGGSAGGIHVTDVTNASRTQLMNLSTLDWDDSLLQCFRIPRCLLPRITSSSDVIGEARIDPVAGIPIAGMLGDQQAALVGQTCFEPGEAKATYGTGCFLLMNTGPTIVSSRAGLITTPAYRFGNEPAVFALEGSIAIAGALVQWLRDRLRIIESTTDVEAFANEVSDNGGVYFVPAFSGLYAPHWNAGARGAMIGLTSHTTGAHIARAALEATAFQVREVLESMQRDASIDVSELRADGGMVRNQLLMQFQADILARAVICPRVTETTALGAAYAAGLAIGYWRNREELKLHWSESRRWLPNMPATEREVLYRNWQKAVGRTLDWL